jgi:hypothetical protein
MDIFVLTDKSFNGNRKDFYFHFIAYLPKNGIHNYGFYLYTLEESFYKYLKAYSLNSDTEVDYFLYEPAPIPTNISGGLGIFASFSSSRRFFSYNNQD